MSKPVRILGIAGSLRRESYNRTAVISRMLRSRTSSLDELERVMHSKIEVQSMKHVLNGATAGMTS